MLGTGGGYQESRYVLPTVPYPQLEPSSLESNQQLRDAVYRTAAGSPDTTTVRISAAGGGLVQVEQAASVGSWASDVERKGKPARAQGLSGRERAEANLRDLVTADGEVAGGKCHGDALLGSLRERLRELRR